MAVTVPFSVSRDDMEKFAELSGDRSRIHMDRAFARARGFEDVVVYGALTVARLSNLVGMYLPGDFGLATSWKIDFNRPLYVDEEAVMEATITHKSEATHTVKLKFQVRCGDKLVASGTAGSKLLDGPD
ncbi:MAG: MaoC/PaaZ C-terminal domain-containing protein [Roseovarius confluentis]